MKLLGLWQPIETAPDKEAFLLWCGDGIEIVKGRSDDGRFYIANDPAPHSIRGTHWMPLPDPPS